jgi:hypothetical protein
MFPAKAGTQLSQIALSAEDLTGLAARHAVHQGLHQPVKPALDLHERGPVNLVLCVALAAQPVRMARVLLAEFIAQRRVHEAARFLSPAEHELLPTRVSPEWHEFRALW